MLIAPPLVPAPAPDLIMGDVEALTDAIKDAFTDLRGGNIPLPQFHGKKGEKPEDHCLKVEDYFKDLKITTDPNKITKFKSTLCGKARQWLEDLTPAPTVFSRPDTDPLADRQGTLKHKFIERWSTKGRTPEALYSEWQNLKFDPAADDIEEFISDVRNLANSLGYPEPAQVMAIKNCMPMEVFTMCLNLNTIEDLKKALIKVFDNPKVKKNYASGSGAAAPSAFSMARYQEDKPTEVSPDDVGKLISKIDSLEYSFRKMSVDDNKRQPKYKPQIAPPRRRGGNQFRGRGRNYNQRNDRSQSNYRSKYPPRGNYNNRGRGRFQNSPNVRRPRIASKTVDKDRDRCHYCKEIGHFIRDCVKRRKDEERAGKFHTMGPLNLEDPVDLDETEDYYAYDDDELQEHSTDHLNN